MVTYFAYGSNMSPAQLAERCPSVRFLCVAKLENYRLAFTRHSANRGCGVADIVPAPGQAVWGVLFELSEDDLKVLDRFEGANQSPPAYQRVNVQVSTENGQSFNALTYEVAAKSAVPLRPDKRYLGLILEGALTWRLPSEYQRALQQNEVM
jgi:gamma-glutamylcyclotransferase